MENSSRTYVLKTALCTVRHKNDMVCWFAVIVTIAIAKKSPP
jgi:hypothetical protein